MITIKDVEKIMIKDGDVYEWFNVLSMDYMDAFNEIPEIWNQLRGNYKTLWNKLNGMVFESSEDFNDKCVEEVYGEKV